MHSAHARNRWPRWRCGSPRGAGITCYLLSIVLVLAGASAVSGAAAPAALACPSGQTTWLRGSATPGVGLLAHFSGATVGGGSSGPEGTWAIPITVRERAGMYPVAVTNRKDGSLIAAFTCYVDVPLGATPTSTPTLRPSASPPPPVPSSTATAETTPNAPAGSPTATAASASPSPPAAVTTSLEPPTVTQPATAASPSATPTPATPTSEPPPPAQGAVVLVTVQADDPDDLELFEYALLENTSSEPQSLAGWRLVHAGSGESYAFPEVTIPAGELLVIWSGDGEDDLATSTRYWPPPASRWAVGDIAELRDAGGHVVSSLVVSPSEEAEE